LWASWEECWASRTQVMKSECLWPCYRIDRWIFCGYHTSLSLSLSNKWTKRKTGIWKRMLTCLDVRMTEKCVRILVSESFPNTLQTYEKKRRRERRHIDFITYSSRNFLSLHSSFFLYICISLKKVKSFFLLYVSSVSMLPSFFLSE
jgi:hypothetical protein